MFPPPTVAANPDKLEEVRATEAQVGFSMSCLISWKKASHCKTNLFDLKCHLVSSKVSQLEKQQILEFESQLAAASSKQLITEQSSLLLSTITR